MWMKVELSSLSEMVELIDLMKKLGETSSPVRPPAYIYTSCQINGGSPAGRPLVCNLVFSEDLQGVRLDEYFRSQELSEAMVTSIIESLLKKFIELERLGIEDRLNFQLSNILFDQASDQTYFLPEISPISLRKSELVRLSEFLSMGGVFYQHS